LKDQIYELRRSILRFLDETVLQNPDEQRTQLDNLLLESGRAFTDALVRYSRAVQTGGGGSAPGYSKNLTSVLRSYNEINREHALRNADADALATFREPYEGSGE
jgi:hypothetical protein